MLQPHICDFQVLNITSILQIPLAIRNIPSFKEVGIDTLKTPLKEYGDAAASIERLRFKLRRTLQQQKARRLLLTSENWPSSFVDLWMRRNLYRDWMVWEDIDDDDDFLYWDTDGSNINQRHNDPETKETAERSTSIKEQ